MRHILSIFALSLIGCALAFSQGIGGQAGIGGKAGLGGGAPSGGAIPGYVQGKVCDNPATTTTITCTYTSNVTSGDCMTVGGALYVGGLGSNPTVTITSSGDTWTTDTYYIQIANYSRAVFLAHGKAASGGSKTITATFSVSFGGGASEGIFVQELSHLNCTLDKAITANSAGSLNSGTTSFTSGTMTTTSDAVDMLVANCGAGASETWTAGGVQDSGVGYAIDATNGVDTASSPAAIEYQAVSATGAFAGLMTISSATSGPCVVVALN